MVRYIQVYRTSKAPGRIPLIIELVPKLIDYALKRMVLEQALAVFRPMACKTAFFKGSLPSEAWLPKTEVLEQPHSKFVVFIQP
jgi:hypothetical protein